ncbi:conserved oligomeric Golgi complex subunit 7 [Planococcus citri]|uniref:conserved oligomeric Golgi complex subunit 7 n=1 Tax=Planococcus citri TaxID=170843 RepID=UPI0031F937EB
MNISAFSEEDFVPKKWINNIFSTSDPSKPSEISAESLVTKLQLYIQEVNSVIEDDCQKMVSNMPKVINETEILNQKVLALKDELGSIKNEMENVEKNTDKSVSTLEKLDRVKNTLENVKQALHEADNWSILASDIEESFDRGNLEEITSKLYSMQQSLNVLSNADDYENKKMQLEGLKNRLEASASPHVVKAFTTANLDEAVKFVNIFNKIERLPHLTKYYIKCQKGSLCQFWKSLIDSDQDLNLVEQLRSLYDMLLVNWQKQMKWCSEVFVNVNLIDMMIELYSDVLMNLDPSLSSCMDIALKQHPQPLLLLLEFYQISSQFQQNLESLYIFNNESECRPDWNPILKSLYFPYVQYASKYGTLERQLLDNYLWEMFSKSENVSDLADNIRSISLTIPDVINIAKEAKARCVLFTKGCAIDGLISALKGFFLKYIDKYKDICGRLEQKIDEKENWQLLKSCLSFQQVVGELLNDVKKLDSQLISSLKSHRNDISIKKFLPLILNLSAQKEYEKLFNSVSNGSIVSLLENVISVIERLSYEVHKITYKVSFQPIAFYLESTKTLWDKLNAENDRELPDYSYSPMEYITQIGEHLITLPQYLEPFLSQENLPLNSVLPILSKETENSNISEKGTYASILLTLVANGTCNTYSDHILNIIELGSSTAKQLAADINYLGNVLEELGIGLTENLQNILSLLRFSAEEYHSRSVGVSPKLVAAIRQMRKIPST